MPLIISHNLMAYNTNRNLNNSYKDLSNSVRRLSSGLRVSIAADDAAGLAIRELMRADIASYKQGVRNASDAISLIQTADGALQVIDEKLIRMKELAEQAATGTYSPEQRTMIANEFQAMAQEINRIANATDFNGIHLLNGNLSGKHDGSGLVSTGALKVHFGTGNDAAEDYYYIGIDNVIDATLYGLGIGSKNGGSNIGNVPTIGMKLVNGVPYYTSSGVISFGVIPKGATNVTIHIDDNGVNDTINLFTQSGKHIAGTAISGTDWGSAGVNPGNVDDRVLTAINGFDDKATYDGSQLNGIGGNVPYTPGVAGNAFTYNGMNIAYSGDGRPSGNRNEYLTIDVLTENLILDVVGSGAFRVTATWNGMPAEAEGAEGADISIMTQEQAQQALVSLNGAIARKDSMRADLGAIQNRLENTVSNLRIQEESLQAAESRISDVDVALETMAFVRNQVLTQTSTAMLAQANSLPQMALQIIQG